MSLLTIGSMALATWWQIMNVTNTKLKLHKDMEVLAISSELKAISGLLCIINGVLYLFEAILILLWDFTAENM